MTIPELPETRLPPFKPRRIYVASSWRNPSQPAFVERLRAEGHEVYDFRHPAPGNHGFGWRQIRPEPPPWSAEETLAVLSHEIATHSFNLDFGGMMWADTCVMLQPCGRSAALELGWSAGAGKHTVAVLVDGQEPELMLNVADNVCVGEDAAIRLLRMAPPVQSAIVAKKQWSRADAAIALFVAKDLLERLVAEMTRWGAEGDGVPEDCTAYTEALALLKGGV